MNQIKRQLRAHKAELEVPGAIVRAGAEHGGGDLHQMQQARTELSLMIKPDEDNKQVNSIFGEQHKKSSYNRVIN